MVYPIKRVGKFFENHDKNRFMCISYGSLTTNPGREINRISNFLNYQFSDEDRSEFIRVFRAGKTTSLDDIPFSQGIKTEIRAFEKEIYDYNWFEAYC